MYIYVMGVYVYIKLLFSQELDRMQRVIREVRDSLCDLKLAIDGTIVMSPNLRASLDAMYDARIPEKWMKVVIVANFITKHPFELVFLLSFVRRFHGNRQRLVFGTPNCWNGMHNFARGFKPIDPK